jgi:ribosomal protein L4
VRRVPRNRRGVHVESLAAAFPAARAAPHRASPRASAVNRSNQSSRGAKSSRRPAAGRPRSRDARAPV